MKDKIAIVVQRYGLEINGGAELHSRLIAERLNLKYDVEIITTCAIEYEYWDNHYPAGTEIINAIKVRRFLTEKKDLRRFQKLSKIIYSRFKYNRRQLNFFNFPYLFFKRRKYNKMSVDFNEWLEVQGPYSKDLTNFIKAKKDDYQAFIFFTYLYHPTNIGIKEVAKKSILIPTTHDEPPFYLPGYETLFSLPKFIMYNMDSEKNLVENVYPQAKKITSEIAGIGFDKIVPNELDIKLDKRYFIYIGRMEDSKGCNILLEYFNRYINEVDAEVELIFIGQNVQHYKESKNVRFLGFIDENSKNYYLSNAEALIIPSLYESLSMVTLEAMQIGKPVIANKKCDVLKNHIEQSKAGFLFENYNDFRSVLERTLSLSSSEKDNIAYNGTRYVKKNYDWETIMEKFYKAIDYVMKPQ